MLTQILAAALALLAAPVAPPNLSEEDRALLRCAAAFALVAGEQAMGNDAAQKWPPVEVRGKEFFVRVMAKLMDEAGLTRADVVELTARGVEEHDRPGGDARISAMMPACRAMKSAAGL